jgi:hypothetical protein
MTNKRNWLGILALVLVFGMTVVGCDIFQDSGITIKFIVVNNSDILNMTITKIEFLNGNDDTAEVLQTESVNLSYGDEPLSYTVSGFTVKSFAEDTYYCRVRVTLDNGETRATSFGIAKDNDKLTVEITDFNLWVRIYM